MDNLGVYLVLIVIVLWQVSRIERALIRVAYELRLLRQNFVPNAPALDEPSPEVCALAAQPEKQKQAVALYCQQSGVGSFQAQKVVNGLRDIAAIHGPKNS